LGKPPLARPELTGQAEGGGFLPQSKDPREESGPSAAGPCFGGAPLLERHSRTLLRGHGNRVPAYRIAFVADGEPSPFRTLSTWPRLPGRAGPSLRAYRIKHDGPALGPMGDIVWTTCNDPPPNGHPPSPTDGNITIMPRGLISSLATSRISSTCSASNAPNAPAKVAIASAGSSRNTGRKANMMKWKEQLNGDCPRRDALGCTSAAI